MILFQVHLPHVPVEDLKDLKEILQIIPTLPKGLLAKVVPCNMLLKSAF